MSILTKSWLGVIKDRHGYYKYPYGNSMSAVRLRQVVSKMVAMKWPEVNDDDTIEISE
jgi:hypothetical protein